MQRTMLFATALVLAGSAGWAQSPRGEASLNLGESRISIDYGRPSLQGRDMIGQAQVGMTWRMGADAATTLESTTPLDFSGKVAPAGSHVLRARKVGPQEWHLLVGAAEDALEVPLDYSEAAESAEAFTIELKATGESRAELSLHWGTALLTTSFSVQ